VAGVHDELLALADHDADLVRARHEVEHPPSIAVLREVEAELTALRAAKRELDATLVPLAAQAATLERDAVGARQRAGVIEARLAESTGAGRELEAMAHERDALASRAGAIDDELYGVLEALEPLEALDATLRASFAAATARHLAAVAATEAERADASTTLAQLEASRPGLTAALDAALLARYEAAAVHAGGVGAARLVDGRCGRCRVAVPATTANLLVRGTDPDAIAICDECGRLLVR
jgi:predicted  nucleic acid-binding Zn-ribbon protein